MPDKSGGVGQILRHSECLGEKEDRDLPDISDLISYYEAELNIDSFSDEEERNLSETEEDFDWEYQKLLQKSFGTSSDYLHGLVEAYEEEMNEHCESTESSEENEDVGKDLEFEYEKALIEYQEKLKLESPIVERERDNLYDKRGESENDSSQEVDCKYHLSLETTGGRDQETELEGHLDDMRQENKMNLYRQQ